MHNAWEEVKREREKFSDVILCNGKGRDETNVNSEVGLVLVAIQTRRELGDGRVYLQQFISQISSIS